MRKYPKVVICNKTPSRKLTFNFAGKLMQHTSRKVKIKLTMNQGTFETMNVQA